MRFLSRRPTPPNETTNLKGGLLHTSKSMTSLHGTEKNSLALLRGFRVRVLVWGVSGRVQNENFGLEAKQRCFSHRAILSLIVSQTHFVFVAGEVSRDMLQNGASHRYVCVKQSTRYPTLLGGLLSSPRRYRRTRGIAAMGLQYRAIWGH